MELHKADCFDILPTLNENSIDLVLVDLPYGEVACKWDIPIDLKKMWDELNRICKERCIYLFFGSMKFGWKLIESNKKHYKYDIVWNKTYGSNFLNANRMPMRCHEFIFVFYKKTGTYNPQKTKGKPYNRATRRTAGCCFPNAKEVPSTNKGDRHPTTILSYRKQRTNNHPTEKPVDLLENLIKQYSNEGDTVLDFTMGSGSTGVACKNTNRKFVGIEKEQEYYDIAKTRCEESHAS